MNYKDKIKKISFEELGAIADKIFKSDNFVEISSGCSELIQLFPILGMEVGLSSIYRVRTDLPKPPRMLKDLLWKPQGLHVSNRANSSEQQLVYFSNHVHTSVEEVREPSQNKTPVSVLAMKPADGASVILYPVGEIFHTIRTNSSRLLLEEVTDSILNLVMSLGDSNSRKLMLTDAMVLDAFNSDDRRISQSISSALFKKMPKDGMLFFNSRKHYGGLNYVCKPEYIVENLRLIGGLFCPEAIHCGYGIWKMDVSKYVKTLKDDGRLGWKSAKGFFNTRVVEMIPSECFPLQKNINITMGHPLSSSSGISTL